MRYAIRKTECSWAVCAGRLRLLEFDQFEEALHVARNAASILKRAGVGAAPERGAPTPQQGEQGVWLID